MELGHPGAILDPAKAATAFVIARLRPADTLADRVRHYWFVRWDLHQRIHRQETLTLPAVNLVVEPESDGVYGVATRRTHKHLEGRGAAFGVLFRGAGFQPFLGRSVHELTDRSAPISAVFRGDVGALRHELLAAGSDDEAARVLDRFLAAEPSVGTAEQRRAQRWMDDAEARREFTRAEDLALHAGVGLRTLQRELRYHVGVGPKQVIRRYRLLDASARLAAGQDLDPASLARDLGYYDQAHFTRDFAAVVGSPPARYQANARAAP